MARQKEKQRAEILNLVAKGYSLEQIKEILSAP